MLLVGLLYCYLALTFLNIGFVFQNLLTIKKVGPTITIIFGMFCIAIVASVWAIFGRLHWEFQVTLLLVHLWSVLKYRKILFPLYLSLYREFKGFESSLKIFLVLTSLLILFYTAGTSNLVDNETYYVQTIKWLNQFGLVPGLGNLHIFFAQTSGWHILQSAFSFSFLLDRFNDLNGFCMLLGIAFSTKTLQEYFRTKITSDLGFGLMSIFLLILLPLAGAPSPDLPVIVFSLILFRCLLEYDQQSHNYSFIVLFILAVFIIYIKIAALPIVLIPAIFYGFYMRNIDRTKGLAILLGLIVVLLFITKNLILSSYPLYPSALFADLFETNLSIPKASYDFWWNRKELNLQVSNDYKNSLLYQYENVRRSVLQSPMQLFGALLTVVTLLFTPIFLHKYENKKTYWIIYIAMVGQFAFLLLTVPQFRFIIAFILFFWMLVLSRIPIKGNALKFVFILSLFPAIMLAFFVKPQSHNHHLVRFKASSISPVQLLIPEPNSNLDTRYEKQQKGNLSYFSPDSTSYIWTTGDGLLPCVNRKQIDYFELKIGYIPQKVGESVSDGFYSKKIDKP